jgi:hypothetical protein
MLRVSLSSTAPSVVQLSDSVIFHPRIPCGNSYPFILPLHHALSRVSGLLVASFTSTAGDTVCRERLNRHLRALLAPTVASQPIAAPNQYPSSVTSSAECLTLAYSGSTSFPLPRQITIEKLSDKVLLKIFCCFLDASPRSWPTLIHICRKWRRIVFDSQQALPIRLFFAHGTPVLKTLKYWPTMPGGFPVLYPPAPEDEVNISLPRSNSLSTLLPYASPSQDRSWKSYPQSTGHFRNWKTSSFCLKMICG